MNISLSASLEGLPRKRRGDANGSGVTRSPAGFCSVSAHPWGWLRRNLNSLGSGWKTGMVFHPVAVRLEDRAGFSPCC